MTTKPLSKDQQAAIDKLERLKVGALFMEMGTGKSCTALELISSKAHKVDYILWLCPYSTKAEIEAERQKWHPELDIDIVGIESIGQSDRIYMETRAKMESKRCFAVMDESLKIKNISAKRTRRALELGKLAEYKLILNGTPLSKNILDLYTQMSFLSPRILDMTYQEFMYCYAEFYKTGPRKGEVRSQCNVEHLVSLISPYIFDAELDIEPRKAYVDSSYSMSVDELTDYEKIKEEAFEEWMMSCQPEMDVKALFARLQSHYTKAEDKERALAGVLEKLPEDEKCLVFVKYLHSIPEGSLRIVGEMNAEQRKAAIEEFRDGDERVLYITYGCGAFGLNLQFCHNVIFLDHTWDYAQRLQAEARVYRMGQEYDVTYHDVYCDCGLEELIRRNQGKKSGLLSDVKVEIKKKGVKAWLKSI